MIPGVTIEFCDEEDFRANREIKGRRRRSEMTRKALKVNRPYSSIEEVGNTNKKEDKK
jgi:hypothetical protein